jgi:hypothetical protein
MDSILNQIIQEFYSNDLTSPGPSITTLKYRALLSSATVAIPGTGSCSNLALS